MKLFKFIRSLFTKTDPTPDLTPAQRREKFCAKGQHRYNEESAHWWKDNGQDLDDDADSLTFSGRHCKDCGHWDIAG